MSFLGLSQRRWVLAPILAAVAGSAAAGTPAAEPVPDRVEFNKHVRPILSNNCFLCHGPDSSHRAAGLRLDVRDAAIEARRGRAAIVPGESAASEMLHRVTHADPKERMPPPDSERRLSARDIEVLRRWIDQGAEYQPHWAYIAPGRPEPPALRDESRITNPIDRFVLQKLGEYGLQPSPEANPISLMRRVYFDLVGLPPNPADIDAFAEDPSLAHYEAVVDRLLASPQFGERMAMDWLDKVRYADTNGYHSDEFRSVWPYRDYVIRAFNENRPFDQFTVEQIAGDLLPNAATEQLVASGYNRLNQITAEGGAQAKEYLAKYAADRVRTTATVWLGATMGCAECHDHKFDPYTTKDFYSFASFFADIEEVGVYGGGSRWEPVLPLPTEEQAARLAALDSEIAALKAELATDTEALAAAQTAWEQTGRVQAADDARRWQRLAPDSATAREGTTLKIQKDLSVLASGPNPNREAFTVTARARAGTATGLRLEALWHKSLGNRLSRVNGNFVLSGIAVEIAGQPVAIASAVADVEQENFPIAAVLDGNPNTGWAVDGHLYKETNRTAVFRFAAPIEVPEDAPVSVRLEFDSQHPQHSIDRFRLSFAHEPEPGLAPESELPADVLSALRVYPELRTPEEADALASYYRSIAPELAPQRERLAQAEAERKRVEESIPYTLLTRAVEPREMRVLPRGDWMSDAGEVVQPVVPAFLPALPKAERRATRLDLARWLMAPENPLTARVQVNRLWAMFFGTGISKVLDDLGSQGEWPTHPELLDWLAVEFRESGWNLKHMVKLMVMSSAYRQASDSNEALDELDPYNRLLARQSRFRLPAETVRDSALAISGLLNPEIGGPYAFPYQPDGYWDNCNTFRGPLIYTTDLNERQYRRGLYTVWKRSFLHPSMAAFDAPAREECTAERVRSNTPLQALVLLNDPTYVEAARVFAARIITEGGAGVSDRITWAFRQALGRTPSDDEVLTLSHLYLDHRSHYTADPDAAKELLSVGIARGPDGVEPPEIAAWTSVARVILNLHETVTRT